MDRIEVVKVDDRSAPPAGQTPGMVREEAFVSDRVWSGVVFTEPGMISGWHHHDRHDTYFFVAAGQALLEFGPAGSERVDARPGDFVHVPQRTVHRESNPGEETSVLVAFPSGQRRNSRERGGPRVLDHAAVARRSRTPTSEICHCSARRHIWP
ncbi:MAG: cupin domain-containing protein [Actinomycetota bacterium]|nr:cupin domain-containing protein [Actinomycetota bacterium]